MCLGEIALYQISRFHAFGHSRKSAAGGHHVFSSHRHNIARTDCVRYREGYPMILQMAGEIPCGRLTCRGEVTHQDRAVLLPLTRTHSTKTTGNNNVVVRRSHSLLLIAPYMTSKSRGSRIPRDPMNSEPTPAVVMRKCLAMLVNNVKDPPFLTFDFGRNSFSRRDRIPCRHRTPPSPQPSPPSSPPPQHHRKRQRHRRRRRHHHRYRPTERKRACWNPRR